jgi:hypothetical protein
MYSSGYSCQTLLELEFARQMFEKESNTKFHENKSSESQVVPCGRMDGRTDRQTDRQTDMTKVIALYRNFAYRLK